MTNENSISIHALNEQLETTKLIDVRKIPARQKSGLHIAGSVWHHPFDAANWWQDYRGHKLVIYCVHGHEVSQAVSGFLRDNGLDCRYVQGGIEAWREAGFAVEPFSDEERH